MKRANGWVIIAAAIAVLVILLAGAAMAADGLVLADGKKAPAVIFVGRDASATETFAAEELQRVVRLMSAAEMPVMKAGEASPAGGRVVIGCPASVPEIAGLVGKLGLTGRAEDKDKLVIRTEGSTLYLAGNNPVGAMYAVYAFLEEVLGVRWFWPGDDGEYIPARNVVTVATLNISEKPDFTLRGYRGFYDADTYLWMARNRMNYGSGYVQAQTTVPMRKKLSWLEIYGGHSFGHIFPEGIKTSEEYFNKYPEHFSYIAGKRTLRQHCYSNPEVRRVFIDWTKKFWKEHPEVEILRLAPMDNPHFCQCDKCKAYAADTSTQLTKFLNEIITETEKTYPGKKYMGYAYSTYKPVPDVKVREGLTVEYCMYDRCYRHALFDPRCPVNASGLKKMQGWMDTGTPLTMYGYHYDALGGQRGYFMPNAFVMADELRYLKQKGFRGFATEIPRINRDPKFPRDEDRWMNSRFSLYLGAKLMWKTSLDEKAILKDWSDHVYGAASPQMVDYYQLMEKAWASGGHISYYFANPTASVEDFITPQVKEDVALLLDKALQTLQTSQEGEDKKRALFELETDRKMFKAWADMAGTRLAWADIAKGAGAERVEALKTAPAERVLYNQDFQGIKPAAVVPGFSEDNCRVRDEKGNRYLEVQPVPRENFIYGNHPRIFTGSNGWINYDLDFRFRFPAEEGVKAAFTVCVRTGGERFGNDFLNYYISYDANACSVSVRERSGRPVSVATGRRKWSAAGLGMLETGKWYRSTIRVADLKIYVCLEDAGGQMVAAYEADVPLGGGHINFLCNRLDLDDITVREIKDPAAGSKWQHDVPRVTSAPRIDGKGDDACWLAASQFKGFTDRKGNPAGDDTEVALVRDDKGLYLLLRCHESDMKSLVAERKAHDDNQWADDCIELFLDPQMTRTDYYHLVINTLGARYDALAGPGMSFDKDWKGPWSAAVSKEKDSWILEIALPYATFKAEGGDGTQWLLGINRSTGGRKGGSSWTDGSYHSPASFAVLNFLAAGK